jgi:hypothetical protein
MSILFLTEQLNNMEDPKRGNRQRIANLALKDQKLCKEFVSITFDADTKASIITAWVLEWIYTHHYLE